MKYNLMIQRETIATEVLFLLVCLPCSLIVLSVLLSPFRATSQASLLCCVRL